MEAVKLEASPQAAYLPGLKTQPEVLIVEDDTTLEDVWYYVLDQVAPGGKVRWVTTEEAAERSIFEKLSRGESYDLIISDVFLSGKRTGVDLWRRFVGHQPKMVLMSSIEESKLRRFIGSSSNQEEVLYLRKPIEPVALKAFLSKLLSPP